MDELTPEEQAEFQQLQAEYQASQQPQEPGFFESIGNYASDFNDSLGGLEGWGKAAVNTITGIPGQIAGAANGIADAVRTSREQTGRFIPSPTSLIKAGMTNYMEDKSPAQAIGGIGKFAAGVTPVTSLAYDKAVQAINPEEFPPTTAQQDAAAFQNNTMGAVIPAATLGAVSTANKAYRAINPSIAQNSYEMFQRDGATAAALNAPRGTTYGEGQLVKDIIQKENTFVQNNPAAGIATQGRDARINALPQFQANIEKVKQSAATSKQTILDSVDNAGLGGVTVRAGTVKQLADAEGLIPQAQDLVLAKIQGPEFLDTVPFNPAIHQGMQPRLAGNNLVVDIPKAFTANQLVEKIRAVDNELRGLGVFDDSANAVAAKDPSYFAQIKPQMDGLQFLRGHLNNQLKSYADQVAPGLSSKLESANARISAMIEYENLASRFGVETLQGDTVGSGRSMTSPINGNGINRTAILDTALGGPISSLAQKQSMAANNARGANAVQSIQNYVDYQTGAKGRPFYLQDDVVQPLNRQTMYGSALGALLPRNTATIDSDQELQKKVMNLAASHGMVPAGSSFSALSTSGKRAIVTDLAKMSPDVFERNPDGANSVIDGEFTDPMERDQHLKEALRRDLSAEERYKIVSPALEKNKYVPLATPTPMMPMQAPREPSLDDFGGMLGTIDMEQDAYGTYTNDAERRLDQLMGSNSRIDVESSGL